MAPKIKLNKDGPLWQVDRRQKKQKDMAKDLGLPDPYKRKKMPNKKGK